MTGGVVRWNLGSKVRFGTEKLQDLPLQIKNLLVQGLSVLINLLALCTRQPALATHDNYFSFIFLYQCTGTIQLGWQEENGTTHQDSREGQAEHEEYKTIQFLSDGVHLYWLWCSKTPSSHQEPDTPSSPMSKQPFDLYLQEFSLEVRLNL